MLVDAEARLRQTTTAKVTADFKTNLPKLTAKPVQPSVDTNGKVAGLNKRRLDEEVHKRISKTRPITLEDPVVYKQNKEKVRSSLQAYNALLNEEIISQIPS